ncbi:MAG: O-antigen ligase family protein [Caldilineaceae bacterium]|nr:O-antigen ligase family protein [Caldilineaceae bacterium]
MRGYLLFLVPTFIALLWLVPRYGMRQALVALYGFHLMFAFDFAALLPGNVNVLFVHLLLLAFVGLNSLYAIKTGKFQISPRIIFVVIPAIILVLWMSLITFVNRSSYWSMGRISTYVIRLYLVDALAIIVGIYLAHGQTGQRLIHFGQFLFFGCILDSIVAVIQTASFGTFLSSNSSEYYLGIFQPLGEKFLERRDLAEQSFGFTEGVRTIQLGGMSFYRGWGTYDGAMVLLIIAAVVATLWVTQPIMRKSKFLWIVLLFSWLGVIVAFFRTGLIILMTLTFLLLLLRFPIRLKPRIIILNALLLMAATSIFVIAITLVTPLRNVVAANLDGLWGERGQKEFFTANGRLSLWRFVIAEAAVHPWTGSGEPITSWKAGWGLNNDAELELSAHSTPLEYVYRGGIIPLGIYIALNIYCLVRLVQLTFHKQLDAKQRVINGSVLLAFLAMWSYQQLNDIKVPQIAMVYWMIVGFASAYSWQPFSNKTFIQEKSDVGWNSLTYTNAKYLPH